MREDYYTYQISWSPVDERFIARVLEFPLLAAHGSTSDKALAELRFVVAETLKDLEEKGEKIPEPTFARST